MRCRCGADGSGRKVEPWAQVAPEARKRKIVAAAGFSVLELLVSFVILMTATLIAGRLLLEAQARMAHSARRAMEPVAEIVLKQLRADVRATVDVATPSFGWSWQPLVLVGHPAGTVTYERAGSELVRTVDAGGDSKPGARVVLRAVRIFRWRLAPGAPLPLVEIELGHREIPRFSLLAAAGQREAPIPLTRSHFVAINPRQAGRTGW